jgi:Protein of unknown function (DUF1638)
VAIAVVEISGSPHPQPLSTKVERGASPTRSSPLCPAEGGPGGEVNRSVSPILLLACGALAREVIALRDRHGWQADVYGVPALLHNTPGKIAPAVEKRIVELRDQYARVIVVYGECGTHGALDDALARLGVERIAGPHCFEQYGGALHDSIVAEKPGTFFLTDFLARHFDALVWRGLGLDRHPELRDDYFGNYEQVVYLAQTDDPDLIARAERAANALGLPLRLNRVGYGDLETRLLALIGPEEKLRQLPSP